jgi:hypothetical protein
MGRHRIESPRHQICHDLRTLPLSVQVCVVTFLVTLDRSAALSLMCSRGHPAEANRYSSTFATWTLHGIQSTCTATLYQTTFDVELRVEHGGELVEPRLSRVGEEPLLLIADQIRSNLIAQGWFELPNRT